MTNGFDIRRPGMCAGAAVCLAILLAAPRLPADEIEVAVESAPVKVGERIIAILHKGERCRLVKSRGAWMSVAVDRDGRTVYGWILESNIRRSIDAGVDENTPAPDAPDMFQVRIDATQTNTWRSTPYLCLRLSLTNQGAAPLSFRTTDLALEADGLPLPSRRPDDVSVMFDPTMRAYREPGILGWLADSELAPGSEAAGWLCFDLSPLEATMQTPLELSKLD